MIDAGSVPLLKDVPAEKAKLVEERKRDEERARGWFTMEGGICILLTMMTVSCI